MSRQYSFFLYVLSFHICGKWGLDSLNLDIPASSIFLWFNWILPLHLEFGLTILAIIFFFLNKISFIYSWDTHRERGRDTGREAKDTGSPMQDSILGPRGHDLGPRQMLNRWATQVSPNIVLCDTIQNNEVVVYGVNIFKSIKISVVHCDLQTLKGQWSRMERTTRFKSSVLSH